ncbi:variable surface protein [Plasmodium gonderi]|uniref:Variable surface protein n=1 Tax=Plasmodium gonderi TaxID=77519 RepID=A0A1Y1JU62_PLAGO|nr:variable surface protein [Plasmodium gonderi]GAW84282.1 variable surface protein [Plasmodium gonderi]
MEDNYRENAFDFRNIFPQCRYDFNGLEYGTLRKPWLNYCSPTCNDFQHRINVSNGVSVIFQTPCILLCMYLKYIQIHESSSYFKVKASCKYFYYKLKELMKNYGGNCKSTKDCYEKMRVKRELVTRMTVPDVCVRHLNDIDDIDDDTYHKFQYLQKLYDIQDKFTHPRVSCHIVKRTIKDYENHYKVYNNVNNNQSFKEEFEKVHPQYNDYRQKRSECFSSPERLYSSSEAGASTFTGIGVLTIAISIIIFILFKYTSYGSFLQLIVRKLRRRMKKKYEHNSYLKDTFDRAYPNSNQRNCRITYYLED